jgi:hypothetical protein
MPSPSHVHTDPLPPKFNSCSIEVFDLKAWLQPGQSHQLDYDPEKNDIHGTFYPAFGGLLKDLQVPKLLSVRSVDDFKLFSCCAHHLCGGLPDNGLTICGFFRWIMIFTRVISFFCQEV